ncbi:MAG: aminomethyl-transferring glycine dehydrogenase subunit GcvPA [Phycisphaerae bacterium]|nr:aminomethyl-transferring glycine dehydrogenase subunit GcvPA [Phycisphaerae bacterium]
MAYSGISQKQVRHMLDTIGVARIDDLFADIPAELRLGKLLNLPEPMDDLSLQNHLRSLANRNHGTDKLISFLGAGSYDHFIPPVVDALASRSEFVTAYTPYQAEASQGVLQAFYEFQTMICEITGMDVTNASMYEAGSATAEAVLMARDITGRSKVLIGQNVHPEYVQIVRTYLASQPMTIEIIPTPTGTIEPSVLASLIDDQTAAVVIQQPDFFGCLNPVDKIADAIHAAKGLLISVVDPISLGLIAGPGQLGVDIVVGEGQPLGLYQNFGGPYLGFMAAKSAYLRRLPGRLIGMTTDHEGRRAFCLTLQTREQHIRRERATSNICSNEGLMAIRAAIYLAAMGKNGFFQVANLCFQKAHYAASQIVGIEGFELAFKAPFFKEFVVRSKKFPVDKVIHEARQAGLLAGVPLECWYPELGDCLLVAVTEKRTRDEIDALVDVFRKIGG